jgi:hypothetical protein
MAGNDNNDLNDMFRMPMRMSSKEAGEFMAYQSTQPTRLDREWVCRDSNGTRIYTNPGANPKK